MKLPKAYRRLLRVPEESLVLLDDKSIEIAGIESCILFLLAKWSVASQLSFGALNAVLGDLSSLSNLKLFIADTDSESTQTFM
jgi:hypothetical protein